MEQLLTCQTSHLKISKLRTFNINLALQLFCINVFGIYSITWSLLYSKLTWQPIHQMLFPSQITIATSHFFSSSLICVQLLSFSRIRHPLRYLSTLQKMNFRFWMTPLPLNSPNPWHFDFLIGVDVTYFTRNQWWYDEWRKKEEQKMKESSCSL